MTRSQIASGGRGFEGLPAEQSTALPSKLPVQPSLSTPYLEKGQRELCALLGPLVSPLLQNPEGGLDLAKLPVASFEDFRSFLITQVRVDGIAFNEVWLDSYHAVLADDRHEPLMRSLYAAALSASGSGLDSDGGGSVSGEASELESHGVGLASVKGFESSREDGTSVVSARGGRGRAPSPGEGAATPVLPRGQGAEPKDSITKDQLHAFTADLIKVSGERFAGNHLRTKEGRARLSNILLDSKNFSHDLRSDLVKGIALGGRNFGTSREAYRRLNQEISVWNYTNTAVSKDELSRATHITLDILQEVASQQEEHQDLLLRYLKRPQDVTRFSGLEKELQRTITDEAIQAKAEYIDWNRDNYDPKIALGVKLDELWLTLIDDARWQQSGSLKTAKNAAFVIKEIESFREKLNEANSEAEFLAINEGIRTLLKGGIGVKGKGTLRSLKDFTASSTVPGMFKDLPEVHRQSYDNLLQYSEELHYAKEMGETISIGSSTEPSPPKGPERSTGKAGAVAGGEVREPTGGTSLAPGPQARGSLAPQVELAGSQKADLNPHKDLASLPKVDLTTPTELTLLPKVSLLPKADEARTPQADASSSVIPAQFHPGQAFPNQDPAKKPKADPKKLAAEEAKRFTEAKSQFIHGLKQAKRSLWYQYKQHKALSRGISQTAKLFNKGDIQEIEAGQAALDKMIEQVEAAQDVSEMKSQIQEIQNQLRKDGPVYLAMVAAEMDGKEQLIGLGQTILIILATRQLGRGMARLSTAIAETQTGQRLANLAQQLRQHQLGQSIHRGMQNNVFAWRATKGFAMGAWISTAENGIAAATDEVHPEGHHAKSWAFDALATGVAMGIFTTAASYMGNSIEKNLLKRMMGRYFGNTKASLHIIGDVIAEMGEETIDATLRAKLEDGDKALGFDQFREIAMVSGLGGFTKTGMIAEMLRKPKEPHTSTPPSSETHSKVKTPNTAETTPEPISEPSQQPALGKVPFMHSLPAMLPIFAEDKGWAVMAGLAVWGLGMAIGKEKQEIQKDAAFRQGLKISAGRLGMELVNRLEDHPTQGRGRKARDHHKTFSEFLSEQSKFIAGKYPGSPEQIQLWEQVLKVLKAHRSRFNLEIDCAIGAVEKYLRNNLLLTKKLGGLLQKTRKYPYDDHIFNALILEISSHAQGRALMMDLAGEGHLKAIEYIHQLTRIRPQVAVDLQRWIQSEIGSPATNENAILVFIMAIQEAQNTEPGLRTQMQRSGYYSTNELNSLVTGVSPAAPAQRAFEAFSEEEILFTAKEITEEILDPQSRFSSQLLVHTYINQRFAEDEIFAHQPELELAFLRQLRTVFSDLVAFDELNGSGLVIKVVEALDEQIIQRENAVQGSGGMGGPTTLFSTTLVGMGTGLATLLGPVQAEAGTLFSSNLHWEGQPVDGSFLSWDQMGWMIAAGATGLAALAWMTRSIYTRYRLMSESLKGNPQAIAEIKNKVFQGSTWAEAAAVALLQVDVRLFEDFYITFQLLPDVAIDKLKSLDLNPFIRAFERNPRALLGLLRLKAMGHPEAATTLNALNLDFFRQMVFLDAEVAKALYLASMERKRPQDLNFLKKLPVKFLAEHAKLHWSYGALLGLKARFGSMEAPDALQKLSWNYSLDSLPFDEQIRVARLVLIPMMLYGNPLAKKILVHWNLKNQTAGFLDFDSYLELQMKLSELGNPHAYENLERAINFFPSALPYFAALARQGDATARKTLKEFRPDQWVVKNNRYDGRFLKALWLLAEFDNRHIQSGIFGAIQKELQQTLDDVEPSDLLVELPRTLKMGIALDLDRYFEWFQYLEPKRQIEIVDTLWESWQNLPANKKIFYTKVHTKQSRTGSHQLPPAYYFSQAEALGLLKDPKPSEGNHSFALLAGLSTVLPSATNSFTDFMPQVWELLAHPMTLMAGLSVGLLGMAFYHRPPIHGLRETMMNPKKRRGQRLEAMAEHYREVLCLHKGDSEVEFSLQNLRTLFHDTDTAVAIQAMDHFSSIVLYGFDVAKTERALGEQALQRIIENLQLPQALREQAAQSKFYLNASKDLSDSAGFDHLADTFSRAEVLTTVTAQLPPPQFSQPVSPLYHWRLKSKLRNLFLDDQAEPEERNRALNLYLSHIQVFSNQGMKIEVEMRTLKEVFFDRRTGQLNTQGSKDSWIWALEAYALLAAQLPYDRQLARPYWLELGQLWRHHFPMNSQVGHTLAKAYGKILEDLAQQTSYLYRETWFLTEFSQIEEILRMAPSEVSPEAKPLYHRALFLFMGLLTKFPSGHPELKEGEATLMDWAQGKKGDLQLKKYAEQLLLWFRIRFPSLVLPPSDPVQNPSPVPQAASSQRKPSALTHEVRLAFEQTLYRMDAQWKRMGTLTSDLVSESAVQYFIFHALGMQAQAAQHQKAIQTLEHLGYDVRSGDSVIAKYLDGTWKLSSEEKNISPVISQAESLLIWSGPLAALEFIEQTVAPKIIKLKAVAHVVQSLMEPDESVPPSSPMPLTPESFRPTNPWALRARLVKESVYFSQAVHDPTLKDALAYSLYLAFIFRALGDDVQQNQWYLHAKQLLEAHPFGDTNLDNVILSEDLGLNDYQRLFDLWKLLRSGEKLPPAIGEQLVLLQIEATLQAKDFAQVWELVKNLRGLERLKALAYVAEGLNEKNSGS